jgi:hypothetical protein
VRCRQGKNRLAADSPLFCCFRALPFLPGRYLRFSWPSALRRRDTAFRATMTMLDVNATPSSAATFLSGIHRYDGGVNKTGVAS